MKEKLWTGPYLFSLLLVFGVNMGYALLNAVMVMYAEVLGADSVMGGYMIAAFTLAALVVRLGIKRLNERMSNRTILIIGLCLTLIAGVGYCVAKTVPIFLFFRIIHGFGFGLSLTTATAISNAYVPASRLAEGVGFTSSANTIANAIGPSLALAVLGDQNTHFLSLFFILLGTTGISLLCSLVVKGQPKAKRLAESESNHWGIWIASVFFLGTLSQGAVNSFLTSYAKELALGNVGFFFTITAVVTFASRFFSGWLQEKIGMRRLSLGLALLMSLSTLSIVFVQTSWQLMLTAVPYGLAAGLLFPIFNYRIIRTVDASQFAYATSIYYCGLDLGYGIGALIWGYVSQYAGYQALYLIAALVLLIMAVLDQCLYIREKGARKHALSVDLGA